MKARHKRPSVFWGIGAGVITSLFIAAAFKEISLLTKAHQELFGGATMLLASGILAYVAFFCHNEKQHIEGKIDKAISTGNSFVLSFTVFFSNFNRRVRSCSFLFSFNRLSNLQYDTSYSWCGRRFNDSNICLLWIK